MRKLSDLGERKLIQIISNTFRGGDEAVGIGDDCAAFRINNDFLLVSTDMINEKTHIPEEMTAWQLGWFIVAINLSDIAAKGGKPLGMLLSMGLPRNLDEPYFKNILNGAESCSKKHNMTIVGGDTKENPSLTLCGTVFGMVEADMFMPRRGCKPGDVVAITGELGKAAAGYHALNNEIHDKKIVEGLLEPKPRVREGLNLSSEKVVNCCMDISDGLSSSLYQLRDLNQVGFEINSTEIPISHRLHDISDKTDLDLGDALHFGGDYELLMTLPEDKFETARNAVKKTNCDLHKIGVVTKSKKVYIKDDKESKVLQNKGYEHFLNNL